MKSFCSTCLRDTEWKRLRKREQCCSCGTLFPCRSRSCGHWDCMEARGEAVADASGVLRKVEVQP